ncbi:MAG: LEA type 2 family protein [Phaeodactylibacter sp.]|nr:LEA type 2 family protein [Phaeodactylibacter sp.]
MMKKRWQRRMLLSIGSVLLLLSLILGTFTCIQYPQFQELLSMEVLDIRDETMTVRLKAAIYNPNALGGTLTGSTSEIYVNELHLGTGTTEKTIKLKGKDTTHMELRVQMQVEMLSKLMGEIGPNKGLAEVRTVGTYKVKTGIKDLTIEAETSEQMDVWGQLEKAINRAVAADGFRILKVKPKNVSFGKTEVELELEIRNNFPFAFELQAIDLKLYADRQLFGSYALQESKQLTSHSKARINGAVSVRNMSIFSSIGSLFFGDRVLRGEGIAQIEMLGYTFKIPVKQEIELM